MSDRRHGEEDDERASFGGYARQQITAPAAALTGRSLDSASSPSPSARSASSRPLTAVAHHAPARARPEGGADASPGVYSHQAFYGASHVQLKALDTALVQFRATVLQRQADQTHAIAAEGTRGSGGPLPDMDVIQRAFGRHDVSGITAHTGPEANQAAQALGAHAYATGDSVVLGAGADRHTVAHEAAHVIQQRGGVSLKSGVGEVGDAYEQHADRVADAVVAGRSAEGLLDRFAGSGASTSPVQARAVQFERTEPGRATGGGDGGGSEQRGGDSDAAEEGGEEHQGLGAINASWFTVEGEAPVTHGEVMWSRRGEQVVLESPTIEFTASVAMTEAGAAEANGVVEVGPVQVLGSSQRTGRYGTPENVVAEHRAPVSEATRDARPYSNNHQATDVPAPYYSQPHGLAAGTPVQVRFEDRPRWAIPATMAGADLFETWGADEFTTSIGARIGDGPVTHIGQAFNWSVPWTATVDGNPGGEQSTGRDLGPQTEGVEGQAIESDTIVSGRSENNTHRRYMTFEAAMEEDVPTLIAELPVNRTSGGESYGFIVRALLAKLATIRVQVITLQAPSVRGGHVHMWMGGSRVGNETFVARDGAPQTVDFRLTQGMMRAIRADSSVRFTMYNNGASPSIHRLPTTFALPFAGSDAEHDVERDGPVAHYNLVFQGIVSGR